MLKLTEYIEVDRFVSSISETVSESAEKYSISIDEEQNVVLKIMDESENVISESKFENPETAIAVLEEFFEIDESDRSWLENYEWNEQPVNEANDSIEDRIHNLALEYGVRISGIDSDAMFDGQYGIAVYFEPNQNRGDLDKFIKNTSYEILRTYGAQSYDYDGSSWKISL